MLAIFSGFKIQLNNFYHWTTIPKRMKENFQLIHYNDLLPLCLWRNNTGRRKRRPYGHVRVKNYQIICLSSSRGPALSSPGPKLQNNTHCGHYFNTLSTTPPPLPSFQMLLIMPNSDPFSQRHSCENAIRFNLGVMTDCLKDLLCTLSQTCE